MGEVEYVQFAGVRKAVLGAVLVLSLVFGSHTAQACSCAAFPENLEQAVAMAHTRADAVFLGVAISVRNKMLRMPPQREVAFSVTDQWKGSIPGTILVRTNVGEVACGYDFRARKSYLVFAYWDRKRQHLTTSFCDLTRTEAEGRDAIAILDQMRRTGKR